MSSGILQKTERPSYQTAYAKIQKKSSENKSMSGLILEPMFESNLKEPVRIILAGAAGQKVVSAGNLIASAAALSGLWTTRRADFPVTIMTGFSVAEVIISPEPVLYSGIPRPDIVALLAPAGRDKIKKRMQEMLSKDVVYFADGLGNVDTEAEQKPLAFPEAAKKDIRKNIAALTAGYLVKELDIFPFGALKEAVRQVQKPKIAEINLKVLTVYE